jgi:hypothetical protein
MAYLFHLEAYIMKAYIRTVHDSDTERLMSIALCRRDDRILVDSDIIEHFPPDSRGVDIKAMAVEYGHATSADHVEWGKPIYVPA